MTEPTGEARDAPRAAYKGEASYWSVATGDHVHTNIAWIYRTPVAEVIRIAGMVCFFNERVDLTIDGILHERPRTQFS